MDSEEEREIEDRWQFRGRGGTKEEEKAGN